MNAKHMTLTEAGVSLHEVVAHVFGTINGYIVNSAADTLEFVSECYDGAGDLTFLKAANAAASYATNGVVRDVSGLIYG